ncbi:MAG: hypothetical protein WAM39_28725, partial [Bryobacteraceae bacterium]
MGGSTPCGLLTGIDGADGGGTDEPAAVELANELPAEDAEPTDETAFETEAPDEPAFAAAEVLMALDPAPEA